MKLLHTADWQLGHRCAYEQRKGDALRAARLNAVKNILAVASQEAVDAILVAGDIFEHNQVDFHWVRDVAALLSRSPAPVYLLPGNHDPLRQDSPFELHQHLFSPPMVVLREEVPLLLPNGAGTLFGCPARESHGSGDPTAWIKNHPRDVSHGIRVGVAHGAMHGTPDECGYFIPRDAADRLDLDYLALGHWHRPKQEGPRLWYAGTHESCEFADDGGFALLVELPAPKSPPRVRTVRVGNFDWCDYDRNIHAEKDVTQLQEELARVQNAGNKLLRLRLSGQLPPRELQTLEVLEAQCESRFFHVQMENAVQPAKSGPTEYRHVLLRKMVEKLTARATAPPAAEELQFTEQEAARRALSHLTTLVGDSGKTDLC